MQKQYLDKQLVWHNSYQKTKTKNDWKQLSLAYNKMKYIYVETRYHTRVKQIKARYHIVQPAVFRLDFISFLPLKIV